jgi:CRP-like cAMP-binding protein
LWEVLRISVWRELSEKVTLIREGDNHRKFGVIVDGFVEVSSNGRVICRLGPSEVVGEMAFLHPSDSQRHATVVTLEPTLFLEINSAALELSSDEVRERFNKVLAGQGAGPLARSQQGLAKLGQTAVQGSFSSSSPGLTPPLELL